MKRNINLNAEAVLDVPKEAPDREISEAILQEFMAWAAARQGLRATLIRVQSGSQEAQYEVAVNGKTPVLIGDQVRLRP